MRTIDSLKLSLLSKAELEKRHMNALKGGTTCTCVCVGCACAGSNDSEAAAAQVKTDNGKEAINDVSSALDSKLWAYTYDNYYYP